MVVQHNIPAMNANRYFNVNNSGLSKSLEKLSSGYAINRAGDNAAGLAVSEKMRSQIAGLTQGVKNAQDGISMIQTYEGALDETDKILQRMKTLATQSANGTYQNDVDREAIQLEFDQLNDELDQIADTDFNGVVMLNGGQMADGTKADANGKIDYSTATRGAQQLGTGDFVKKISTDGYTGTDKETVTFTSEIDADGNVTWKSDSETAAGTEANGGFTYKGASVHVDTTKVVSGDTVVVEFNPAEAAKANTPAVTGTNTDMGTAVEATAGDFTKPSITFETVASQEMADAINSLGSITVESKVNTTDTTVVSTINGKNNTELTAGVALNDQVFAKIDSGKVKLYAGTSASGTEIGEIEFGEMKAAASKAGTITTELNFTQASYVPAKGADIKIIEPDSKVSQANSNDASTAVLNYTNKMVLQAGARTKDSVNFTFNYDSNGLGKLKANMNCSSRSDGLGTKDLSLATQESSNSAIDKIDNAINKVSMVRASFGATQNRLEHKIDNMNVTKENITSAESRIRDTDMAAEMTNFTKNQILSQASQAMLAQANQLPQGVLQLLG